jgi:hypothetical protein
MDDSLLMIVSFCIQVVMHKLVSWMTVKRILFILALVLPAALYADETSRPGKSPQEMAALQVGLRKTQDPITLLEQRLIDLEKHLQGLPGILNQQGAGADVVVIPPVVPQSTPQEWKRRDFNGVPFYIVPLGSCAMMHFSPAR